jgi:hypothetical protein
LGFHELASKKRDIIPRTIPPQKGKNPGPGSFQAPISMVEEYREKKAPTSKKNTAAMRS